MRKVVLPLLVTLLATATAQEVKSFNVNMDGKSMSNDALQGSFTVSGDLPASFPKPATTVFAGFNCQQGVIFSSLTKPADIQAFSQKFKLNKSKTSPFTGQIAGYKFTCPQNRATVSSPKLWSSLTMNDTPAHLSYLQQSISETLDRNIVFSKNHTGLVVKNGLSSWVFTFEGGNFKVLQVNGAVSLTQGGKPQPIFMEGQLNKTLKISLAKPFTIHVTKDQGET